MNGSIVLLIIMSFFVFLFSSREGMAESEETAIFGGGCFWCMEPPFERLEGVKDVISGYTGDSEDRARYELVSSGATKHYEAVRVTYDPGRISFRELVETFWRQIDPTDGGGQFADRGRQYRTAIFYTTDKQREIAEQSKVELEESGRFDKPVVTEILAAQPFYPAEEYHQDYYRKNMLHYSLYKVGSGRDQFIKQVWMDEKKEKTYAKPGDRELRDKLTARQYDVTQKDGTEPAFNNEYWDNEEEGIYVDIVSGEPLFSSKDKFKSGTGWPSFTRPLEPEHIIEKQDRSFFMVRTEVRSKYGDSHLGHVFNDGPAPTNLRYCINSASLRFIPADRLEDSGYGEYRNLFK